MRRYLIQIRSAAGCRQYHGLFSHPCDAIAHGLDLTAGQPARISAKVLP